ncbi:MAG: YcaO-like family protein [Desulforegulaceae bacterium]|nr:YcaO-like family protein [Desulforegulaceae bacterium]
MINYKIKLENTSLSIGYFAPIPDEITNLDQGLSYIIENKFDSFMRNYLISLFLKLDKESQKNFLKTISLSTKPEIKSFESEILFLQNKLTSEENKFSSHSPLIYLKTLNNENLKEHNFFSFWMRKNTEEHLFVNEICPDFIPDEDKIFFNFSIDEIKNNFDKKENSTKNKNFDFFENVLSKFNSLGISSGNEMRHFNCLSPHGILRKWYMKTKVKTKKADFTFQGIQTSYGKGLELENARISCLMEMSERKASFVSVENMKIKDKKNHSDLVKMSLSQGLSKGLNILDPNSLRLEAPYMDDPLYWIKAKELTSPGNEEEIYIPAQISFLFLNLDEPDLFSSLDSTGLASGDSEERAKLAGILEAVERDSEFISPFDPDFCFKLKSRTSEINNLLNFYKSRGIDFFFQSIESETGIPCFRAFVYGNDGAIHKGCSADLNSKKALLDALFEVPYPISNNPPSKKITYPLKEVFFEDLPDYSTGEIKTDLEMLENYFYMNKIKIIYSELTQASLEIPVFKTIIPGFELNGDFDNYHRVSKRQFNKFKKIFKIK